MNTTIGTCWTSSYRAFSWPEFICACAGTLFGGFNGLLGPLLSEQVLRQRVQVIHSTSRRHKAPPNLLFGRGITVTLLITIKLNELEIHFKQLVIGFLISLLQADHGRTERTRGSGRVWGVGVGSMVA